MNLLTLSGTNIHSFVTLLQSTSYNQSLPDRRSEYGTKDFEVLEGEERLFGRIPKIASIE